MNVRKGIVGIVGPGLLILYEFDHCFRNQLWRSNVSFPGDYHCRPMATGRQTDVGARVFAEFLKNELRVAVVVDNRPEAGGCAKAIVARFHKVKPDGDGADAVPASRIDSRNHSPNPHRRLWIDLHRSVSSESSFRRGGQDTPYKSLKVAVGCR